MLVQYTVTYLIVKSILSCARVITIRKAWSSGGCPSSEAGGQGGAREGCAEAAGGHAAHRHQLEQAGRHDGISRTRKKMLTARVLCALRG